MTKLGIVNKQTVISATEDGREVESHDRQRLLPRHMMMMMFEIYSEKTNITDEHVVTILSMLIFSALKSVCLPIENLLDKSLAKEKDDYLMQET